MIRPRCFLGLSFAASWLSLPLFYYLPGNPDKRQNGFDRFGRVADWAWKTDGGTAKDRYTYGYDRNSNRLWRKNWQASNKDEYYGYDALNRLTKFNRGELVGEPPSIADPNAVLNQAWPELEALGNWRQFKWDSDGGADSWTVQDRTHNKVNETLAVSGSGADWPDPNYDAAGNMIYGPHGIPWGPNIHLVYDAWNRLTHVDCEGDWGDYSYRYDGLHRRIRKIDEEYPYDYYYNNSWQVLEIRQDQEPNAYEQYVWGANYIDAAVVRWHDGNLDGDLNDQGDNTLYYTYDGNFNVTALVEPDGDVVERYDYDPYGNGPGWGSYSNEILFCGYRRAEGGLYYVRNRYYHPRLGRWMSREPMIFPWNRCILSTRLGGLVETIRGLGGGAWGANLLLTLAPYFDGQNCYGYTRSNPNDFFDPSGCWTWHGVWEWIDLHIVTPISYLVPGSELVQAAKCAPGVGAIDAYAAMQKRALECQANGIDFDADPEYQRLRRLTLKAGEAAAKECCRK